MCRPLFPRLAVYELALPEVSTPPDFVPFINGKGNYLSSGDDCMEPFYLIEFLLFLAIDIVLPHPVFLADLLL